MRVTLPLLAVSIALAGCTTTKVEEPAPPPLIGGTDKLVGASKAPITYEQFAAKTRNSSGGANVAQARVEILRDAAISYSAQAGYERRVYEIMQELEKKSPQLSEDYNFNSIVYVAPREAGYVIPPVVTRATEALTITKGGRESVAADEYYRIEQPGRIVGVVPTWRDYLVMPLDKATEPDEQFLPIDKEERAVWERYMAVGWKEGRKQAEEALQINLNLLKRDYGGMMEYRRLVEAGLIKSLLISSSEVRARGTADELFIGQRRVKIENDATFVTNPKRWKPVTRRVDK
ncbi:type IV secretory system conjugative DNA transfer family protein [Brucella thiophenivorans]|uniref:Putative lipoprotein n=1 Tax=Brucella thiophenivorans TaxID=571255 RepID=A0A256FSA1_9HYPH|nr:type IV secretory system conjugative DNA transfer family protein [Brucella thiophenivorans]OYR17596.1 putative lipoprotein [Brucella thiophenivorans]